MEIFVPVNHSHSHPQLFSPAAAMLKYGLSRRPSLVRRSNLDLENFLTVPDLLHAILSSSGKNKNTSKGDSKKTNDKHSFEIKLNVKEYKPEELNVKMTKGMVTIEGKHEESKKRKFDDDNDVNNNESYEEEFISKRFKRSFNLPSNIIEDKIECKFSSDGQLILSAPLKAIEAPSDVGRMIKINVESSKADGEEKKNMDPDKPKILNENDKIDSTSSEGVSSNEKEMDTEHDGN